MMLAGLALDRGFHRIRTKIKYTSNQSIIWYDINEVFDVVWYAVIALVYLVTPWRQDLNSFLILPMRDNRSL